MPELGFFPQIDQSSLAVLSAAFFVVVILNLIPVLTYPFYIFYVAIHELGHVFAARLINNRVIGFWVFSDATGVTESEGSRKLTPFEYLIAFSAGYIGTTLFVAWLILLTGLPHLAHFSLGILGGLLIFLMFLYGKQGPNKSIPKSRVTLISTAVIGILLIGIAWLAPLEWSIFILYILAIEGAFVSLHLITDDLAAQVENRQSKIDPDMVAKNVGCSPRFWQVAWSFLSIVILGAAFWFTWLRNWPV